MIAILNMVIDLLDPYYSCLPTTAPVSARVGAINPKLQSRIHCQSCRQSKGNTGIQVPFGRKVIGGCLICIDESISQA